MFWQFPHAANHVSGEVIGTLAAQSRGSTEERQPQTFVLFFFGKLLFWLHGFLSAIYLPGPSSRGA